MIRFFRSPYSHIVLIFALGLLAYSNTFQVPFQWDEEGYIFPVARDLSYFMEPARAKWFEFYDFFISRYAAYLTFALNYKIHGLSVQGYHVFNTAVHLINAMLVYFLVLLIFKTPSMAGKRGEEAGHSGSGYTPFFAALLFVSHPVQTEAVTYIMQRSTSLATMFYLGSVVLYMKWRLDSPIRNKSGGSVFYVLSLLSALLSVKAKEIAFTLPVAIALCEVSFFPKKRRLLPLAPFFLIAAVIPITLIHAEESLAGAFSRASRSNSMLTRQDYLLTQFSVVVTYVRLLFFPVGQNLDYDYPSFHSLLRALPSLLFLLSVFALAVFSFRLKGLRPVSFGILWFFIALSVESSVIPIADLCVEHRMYLPSAGFFMAASAGVFHLKRKIGGRAMTALSASFLTLAVLVLAFLTYERNNVWESRISLWEDAAEKSPLKARTHSNLGLAYLEAGSDERAVEQFNIALGLDPANASSHNNLGSICYGLGRLDEAIGHYREAVGLQPDLVEAHYNLGIAYSAAGDAEKAAEHYETALRHRPDMASAHYNLGVLFGAKGLIDKAIEHYESALRISPDFKAHVNLGMAYKSAGRMDEAMAQQRMALTLNPGCAEAYFNIGNIHKARGQNDQAVETYLLAVGLRPDYEGAHLNLGLTYLEEGLYDRAVAELETALSLNPQNTHARKALLEATAAKSGTYERDGPMTPRF